MVHSTDLFILGAGFSKAVSSLMPSMSELGDELYKLFYSGDAAHVLDFPEDIELQLTYLSRNHPWLSESENLRNRAMFLDLSRGVRQVIQDRTLKIPAGTFANWLTDLIAYWATNQATVVTLDYDCLVEMAAQATETTIAYQAPLSPLLQRVGKMRISRGVGSNLKVNLLKLHGSVNWFYSGSDEYSGDPRSLRGAVRSPSEATQLNSRPANESREPSSKPRLRVS
jgi:hypothetical protein